MNSYHYIIDNITAISKCQCRCISETDKSVYPQNLTESVNDGVVSNTDLFHNILNSCSLNLCNLYIDSVFIYGVFRYNKMIFVIGPATVKQLSYPAISNYLKKNQFGSSFLLPYIFVDDFINITNFFYGLVTGDQSNPLNSYNAGYYDLLNKYIDEQSTIYELKNSEYERRHFPYKLEEEVNASIIQGTPIDKINQNAWQFGILSSNSLKQYEYECVCAVTLITRTAIQSGVLESKAYSLSDLILQKLSVAKDIVEMKQIYEYGSNLFNKEIKTAQTQISHNPYINEAKNYIAKHIYEKIRLEDLASEVNLTSNYLSNIFKQETGETLSHYILNEKVKKACNLLKYSNVSISAIAEYIQITPQNYFTKVFRKFTGITPAKYRSRYKTAAFQSKS